MTTSRRRRRDRVRGGMTFIEMVIALFVLGVVSTAAYPVAEHSVRRSRELELRQSLRTMREAIDTYHAMELAARQGVPTVAAETAAYPPSLERLVELRLLRQIPVDPMTDADDWIVVSTTDEFDGRSDFVGDGRNVFDVRSRADGGPVRGLPYRQW